MVEFLSTSKLVEFLSTPELELFINARIGIIQDRNFYQRQSWNYSNIHWRPSQEYYKQIIIA